VCHVLRQLSPPLLLLLQHRIQRREAAGPLVLHPSRSPLILLLLPPLLPLLLLLLLAWLRGRVRGFRGERPGGGGAAVGGRLGGSRGFLQIKCEEEWGESDYTEEGRERAYGGTLGKEGGILRFEKTGKRGEDEYA
jgi:hypothetical protein